MGRKLQRRTVYAATIIALLALVGGFAMAASFSTTTLTATQGGTTTTLTNTAWAGSSVSAVFTTNGAGCTGSPVSVTSATAVSAYVNVGSVSGACALGDFAEEIVFTATVPQGTSVLTDTFTIYSDSSYSTGQATLTVAVTESGTGTYVAELDLYSDYGSTTPPASISALNVVVNGQL